ncbi:GTPase [Hankyongella ginsenosidimutans]|uniref:GTPase n=1 Tax=Hankyongella ginsenosidimutans TaxID=1763828 RepID=UPI0024829CC8|nr:GTPase [Hankyongella ginsenosidimutans]
MSTARFPRAAAQSGKALNAKVIDRTGLVLEIFSARARTREGVLQVELAHLTYQQSRLVRSWTHLERQRGASASSAGLAKPRSRPTALLRDRIAKLRRELEDVKRTRQLHRVRRQKAPYPVVALVGYTNAGKSTLFNRLTGAGCWRRTCCSRRLTQPCAPCGWAVSAW